MMDFCPKALENFASFFQVIESDQTLSPVWRSRTSPLKGSRKLTIPKRSQGIARFLPIRERFLQAISIDREKKQAMYRYSGLQSQCVFVVWIFVQIFRQKINCSFSRKSEDMFQSKRWKALQQASSVKIHIRCVSEFRLKNTASRQHAYTQDFQDVAPNKNCVEGPCRHMGVSKNRGTPKSSILIAFSIKNHPFWGTFGFGNTHMSSSVKTPKFWEERIPNSPMKFLGRYCENRRFHRLFTKFPVLPPQNQKKIQVLPVVTLFEVVFLIGDLF